MRFVGPMLSAGALCAAMVLGLAACGTKPAVPARKATTTPSTPSIAANASTPSPLLGPAPKPPYSPPVIARFPAPAVVYNTPGLSAGATGVTSNPEVQSWMRDLVRQAGRWGLQAAVLVLGGSPTGQPLEALVLTRAPEGVDPAALQNSGRPTVLLVAQSSVQAPAASEALLVLAQELAQGSLMPLLERINVIIVARADPDGALDTLAAQAPANQDFSLRADHLLLRTPQAQALAQLMRDYQPSVVVDAHEYSLSEAYFKKLRGLQKFDALLQVATNADMHPLLSKAAQEWFRTPLVQALQEQSLSQEWYHSLSEAEQDSKVVMGQLQPGYLHNVAGLENTVGLSVQTRGVGLGRWHLQRRVHTHVVALTSVLRSAEKRTSALAQLLPYVAREVSAQACKGKITLEAAATPAQYDLTLLNPSTGVDKTVTVDWDSTLVLEKRKTRPRPCGYWLDASASDVAARLQQHGVRVQRLKDVAALQAENASGFLQAPAGSYYVPLNQPMANLAAAMLESLAALEGAPTLARISTVPKIP